MHKHKDTKRFTELGKYLLTRDLSIGHLIEVVVWAGLAVALTIKKYKWKWSESYSSECRQGVQCMQTKLKLLWQERLTTKRISTLNGKYQEI